MTDRLTITRRLEADIGHRLMGHEGKCRNVHGHRYVFEVTVSAARLDDVGRVIDFGVVKTILGQWLDDTLDHGMVLQCGDPLVQTLLEMSCKVVAIPDPPTAENLALLFLDRAHKLLPSDLTVEHVRVYETPNCWADARR